MDKLTVLIEYRNGGNMGISKMNIVKKCINKVEKKLFKRIFGMFYLSHYHNNDTWCYKQVMKLMIMPII